MAKGNRVMLRPVLQLLLVICVLAVPALGQVSRSLSIAQIEDLLKHGVSTGRVAELVTQSGVNFEVTPDVTQRLKKAGADTSVTQAVEKASLEFAARNRLQQQRKAEADRQGIEEEKRKMEETRRRGEEEAKRNELEEERKQIKTERDKVEAERKSLEAERKKLEAERRKLLDAKKPLSVADIERLLKDDVPTRRISQLIEKERGIDFAVTSDVRERLKKAGADSEVLRALEAVKGKRRN
jgi:hypothetical protein